MRTFIAITLSDEVRKAIVSVQRRLAFAGAHVTWVKPENIHLTLKFLGELDAPGVEQVRQALIEAARAHGPFPLEFSGIGTFPPMGHPRVVWVGCAGDTEPVKAMAEDVEELAEAIGIPREQRPFTAHATLGRVKSNKGIDRLQQAIQLEKSIAFGRQIVKDVILFRSRLHPAGSVYEEVARVPLSMD